MIACLNIPYFAASVEERDCNPMGDKSRPQDGKNSGPGLVIGGQPWEPQPVYAFSREVAGRGVKPGMSLRLAHVLSPEAYFMPATPPRYLNASGEIVDVLTDFTHLLEPEDLWDGPDLSNAQSQFSSKRSGPAGHGQEEAIGFAFRRQLPARYTVDLESIPPTEALDLACEIGRQVRQFTHLQPAIGLAKNKFVAQVAAAQTRSSYARSLTQDNEFQFLATRSIHYLPLDKETVRRLSLLGIRTLGQLAALPLAGIQEQFGLHSSLGQAFIQLHNLAQGRSSYLTVGEQANLNILNLSHKKRELVIHHFEEPITNKVILKRILDQMAADLAGRLKTKNLAGRTIGLSWEWDGRLNGTMLPSSHPTPSIFKGEMNNSLRLPRRHPVASRQAIRDSLHELLSRVFRQDGDILEHGEGDIYKRGIIALAITISDLVPISVNQPSLFELAKSGTKVVTILENLTAKHGRAYFLNPLAIHDGHPLPERRFKLEEWGSG